jgi:tetratricopeptide (TPR) repeat protein
MNPLDERTATQAEGQPIAQAEQRLAAARQADDRHQEAVALADLGIAHLHKCDASPAVKYLEDAWTIFRFLKDRPAEGDVLGYLGLARLRLGQAPRALPLFEQELAIARQSQDRYAEKRALTHLGQYHGDTRNPRKALVFYEQALNLVSTLGDHTDEAQLCWQMAIQMAELGRRDQALTYAQATVEQMRAANHPDTARYADHLDQFQRQVGQVNPSEAIAPQLGPSSHRSTRVPIDAATSQPRPSNGQAPGRAVQGPGLLRMVLTAAKAAEQFVRSGFQTVATPIYQQRLQVCASCEYHTGIRCRLCGCFTAAKAKLPHEDCPVGKWPKIG